jgi:hypothetical protein
MMQGKEARPYLFKNPTYRYEEEVRSVFGAHPDLGTAGCDLRSAEPKRNSNQEIKNNR